MKREKSLLKRYSPRVTITFLCKNFSVAIKHYSNLLKYVLLVINLRIKRRGNVVTWRDRSNGGNTTAVKHQLKKYKNDFFNTFCFCGSNENTTWEII